MFLPVIAYFLIGETINITGVLAVVSVTVGVIIINLEEIKNKSFRNALKVFKTPGTIFALLAAFTVASYTVWDKMAIREIHPFVYFYLYTFLVAVFYLTQVIVKYDKVEVRAQWKKSKLNIFQVAFFNTFTYILVLIALSTSKATYVGSIRQTSLIIGGFLGWKYLNESLSLFRILGIVFILIGGILTLLAK